MAAIAALFRYPVKGLSPQPLRSVRIEAGRPVPFDRVFALARPRAPVDPAEPRWARKGAFVQLMLDEALATVRTELDEATLRLSVSGRDGTPLLAADLGTAQGRRALEGFVAALVPGLGGRPVAVRGAGAGGHFMDKPDPVLSLLNLATLRSLEERWNRPLDPRRFRANIHVDGIPPWAEFDWVGGTVAVNGVVLRVDRRNGRCAATDVNPDTGARDMAVPAALREAFGHKDLGVYLLAESGGTLAVGDILQTPPPPPATATAPSAAVPGTAGRFICTGCYRVLDGNAGPAALPPDWRCPDCGTDAARLAPLG